MWFETRLILTLTWKETEEYYKELDVQTPGK